MTIWNSQTQALLLTPLPQHSRRSQRSIAQLRMPLLVKNSGAIGANDG